MTDNGFLSQRESSLRKQLGIPPDARQVLFFAESSHWDPNWLRTSQEYFGQLVGPGLEQVVAELHKDEQRVYSIECMFFLRLFWESHPELHEALRSLLNTGRLRLTGSGVTTPDTLVPSAEAILRDLLLGQEWLRQQGITQEPRLAYFPDCFGHSPNLPALLNAAGFDRSAVTRIDGMWFMSADMDLLATSLCAARARASAQTGALPGFHLAGGRRLAGAVPLERLYLRAGGYAGKFWVHAHLPLPIV